MNIVTSITSTQEEKSVKTQSEANDKTVTKTKKSASRKTKSVKKEVVFDFHEITPGGWHIYLG
jgi:hypothetical protein